MSDSVTFEIPQSELANFSATLEAYANVNSHTFKDICNTKARDLAFKAQAHTDKANSDEIRYKLGQSSQSFSVSKKTGKVRAGKRNFGDLSNSLAARIINARNRDAGRPLLFGARMESAAAKLINARVKAVGFIKSGWITAIRGLSAITGYSLGAFEGRQRGSAKGSFKPATETFTPYAEIINSATNNSDKADAKITAGLRAAMVEVSADMETYILKKMQPAADAISAK